MASSDAVKSLVVRAIEDEFDRQAEFGYAPGVEDLTLVISDCLREADATLASVAGAVAAGRRDPALHRGSIGVNLAAAHEHADPAADPGTVAHDALDRTQEIVLTHKRLVSQIASAQHAMPDRDPDDVAAAVVREDGLFWQMAWSTCALMADSAHSPLTATQWFDHLGADVVAEAMIALKCTEVLEQAAMDVMLAVHEVVRLSGDRPAAMKPVTPDALSALDSATKRLALVLIKDEEEVDDDEADDEGED